MHVKLAAVTLALSLPPFLWPPKPARAATVDVAPAMPVPAASGLAHRPEDGARLSSLAERLEGVEPHFVTSG